MPLVRGRKRRAEPEQDATSRLSSEPTLQRQRTASVSQGEASGNESEVEVNEDDLQSDDHLDLMVRKLVRLALACEYQRRPIRRADIGEKVLGDTGSRQFKAVFNHAQLQLRYVFGMEMVELPARDKVTLAQRRAAQKLSQQSKSPTAWVLISTLPPQFRDTAFLPPPSAPTSAEESKYVAIYTLLFSLISLAGGTLNDDKMNRYLRRVEMEDNTPLDGFEKTEKLLKRLEKDGYVYKVREPTGLGDEDVYWVVGPRGKVEVGDEGVRGLLKDVYGELDEAEDDELEHKLAKSLGMTRKVARHDQGAQQSGQSTKRARPKTKNASDDDEEEEEEDGDEEDDDEGER